MGGSMSKSSWVKFQDMGGPLHRGARKDGKYIHVYDPQKPWGVWTQILGVIAACEGRYDTVVMYDDTGVTFGAFQWTFTSGRLQRFLESLKVIPTMDFVSGEDGVLFDLLMDDDDQIFAEYGFRILDGQFITVEGEVLNPRKHKQEIVNVCLSRSGNVFNRSVAIGLCDTFARIGAMPGIQAAQNEYAKIELKQALGYRRPPLASVGGTIKHMLPDEVWGTPIPAIFFNLYQNLPGGSFKLFKSALSDAEKKGIVTFNDGYHVQKSTDDLLLLIWEKLCRTSIADWGFRSKQYLANKKNTPRITRIQPAIKKYYGIDLQMVGR
jgi:hypothetical protein